MKTQFEKMRANRARHINWEARKQQREWLDKAESQNEEMRKVMEAGDAEVRRILGISEALSYRS